MDAISLVSLPPLGACTALNPETEKGTRPLTSGGFMAATGVQRRVKASLGSLVEDSYPSQYLTGSRKKYLTGSQEGPMLTPGSNSVTDLHDTCEVLMFVLHVPLPPDDPISSQRFLIPRLLEFVPDHLYVEIGQEPPEPPELEIDEDDDIPY